jgi:sugar (glycoside-pentoside-hexuronide) transporter
MENIKAREKWFYGMGSLGKDLIQGMFMTYLMVFYTDVFGIGAAAAGILLMVARIWDALLNPIIGITIDRTRTKWGKSRPYVLLMPFPFLVFAVLTFTVPDLGVTAKLVYAYVTYILAGTFFTFYDVALWSMLPSLTTNLKDRSTMIALARIFTMVGILTVSTMALPMINSLGGENIGRGYTLLVLILAVISIIFSSLAFFNTKEKVTETAKPPKFKEQIRVLANNKPLLIVICGVIINSFNMGINNAVGIYHLTYYLKAAALIPVYMLLTAVASMIGMALAGTFVKKLGNRKTTIYTLALSVIPTVLMFFIPTQNITLMFILMALSSLIGGIPAVSTTGMIAETVDYTELKTGIRADGLIFSFNSFSIQFGMALAAGAAGVILQFAGYVPNDMNQGPTALLWMNLLRTIIPAIVCALSLIVIRLYPINKKDHEEITMNLKARQVESNKNAVNL